MSGYLPNYPNTKRDDNHFIILHDTKVSDPYYHLELDNKKFIDQQRELFEKEIRNTEEWKQYRKRLKEISNFERRLLPRLVKDTYFYLIIDGNAFHHVLYKVKDLKEKPQPLFDFNIIENSENIIPIIWSVNPEATHLVVCYRKLDKRCSGTIAYKGIDKPIDYHIVMKHRIIVGSKIAWDTQGFYYGSLTPNKFPGIYYHSLNNENDDNDELIYEFDGIGLIPIPLVSDDQKYLFIFVKSPMEYGKLIYFSRLRKDRKKIYQIVTKWGWTYKFIVNLNNNVYFLTSKKANTNHIIQIDLHNRKPKCHCEWTEIIGRQRDFLIDATFAGNHYFILYYMRDGLAILKFYSLKDRRFLEKKILQNIGVITLQRSYNIKDPVIFYQFESFHIPPKVYRINIEELSKDGQPETVFESKMPNFSPKNFFVDFKTFESYDRRYTIPLYIVGKKVYQNAPRPLILEVNGGFNECLWPKFDPYIFAFFEIFSGSMATVYVRGGGERGRKYWNSGRYKKKLKGVYDYQLAQQYLTKRGYTTRNSLILEGYVNGGFIVSLIIAQAPNSCAVAIPICPITDLINFVHICTRKKLIWEYGDPHKDRIDFKNLLSISPYHCIKAPSSETTKFPAVLVVGVMKHELVPIWHSCKFVAELQNASQNNSFQYDPVFLNTTPELEFIYSSWNAREMINHYADKYVMIKKYSAS